MRSINGWVEGGGQQRRGIDLCQNRPALKSRAENCRRIPMRWEDPRSFRQRHHAAAHHDEGPAQQEQGSGFLAESQPGDHLRREEEKGDVRTNKPAEVPGRGVDRISVKSEDEAAEHEERPARRWVGLRSPMRISASPPASRKAAHNMIPIARLYRNCKPPRNEKYTLGSPHCGDSFFLWRKRQAQ